MDETRAGKPPGDRRRHPRYPVSLDAAIRVPLPEKGDVTLKAKVTIRNFSVEGACVRLHYLKKEHAPLFVEKRRKGSLVCRLPAADSSPILSGEIVWTDLRTDATPSHAFLGLYLGDSEPPERERLAQFLAQLAKQNARR